MNNFFGTPIETHYQSAMCPVCKKQNNEQCVMDLLILDTQAVKTYQCANYDRKDKEVPNEQ